MEINFRETVIENMIATIEIAENHLQKKIDEYEKVGLEPKLTRTDIMLFFSRMQDELKESLANSL